MEAIEIQSAFPTLVLNPDEKIRTQLITSTFILLLTCTISTSAWAQESQQYVFSMMEAVGESPAQIATQVGEQLQQNGYEVLSTHEISVPDACPYTGWVVSAVATDLIGQTFDMNARTAPYALVDRVAVFEDEQGFHTTVVNPQNVLRTVFVDASDSSPFTVMRREKLEQSLQMGEGRMFGQERSRGHIGKTMGVMAGGPFDEKIQVFQTVSDMDVDRVATLLEQGFNQSDMSWGLEIIYRLDIADQGVTVLGISGDRMESKSFSIVGAGSDKLRNDNACPGLAHAAAYPLEVVLRTTADGTTVELIDAMYRMKMFFEDAGKWAFMKNMTMPGSLADEIKGRVEAALSKSSM